MPAPIKDAPTESEIAPRAEPMPTIATMSGSPVAPKKARLAVGRGPSSWSQSSADAPRETSSRTRKSAASYRPSTVSRLSMSKFIPVTTK